jgi:hypothetical protein
MMAEWVRIHSTKFGKDVAKLMLGLTFDYCVRKALRRMPWISFKQSTALATW